MSGTFYSMGVNAAQRRLVFGMGLPQRVGSVVLFASLTAALLPGLIPGSGVVIETEGWISAGVLWGLAALGAFWRDSWIFEASGTMRRVRGWGFLVVTARHTLKGFEGWTIESIPGPFRDPSKYRVVLTFRTAERQWRIDGTFAAPWLQAQRPALDLWWSWLKENEA